MGVTIYHRKLVPPECGLYSLAVNALHGQQRGRCMSAIVKSVMRYAGCFEDALKSFRDGRTIKRRADAGSENEIINLNHLPITMHRGRLPLAATKFTLLSLPAAMSDQSG